MGCQNFASLSLLEVGYILGKGRKESSYCDKCPLSLLVSFNDRRLLKRHDLPTGANVTEKATAIHTTTESMCCSSLQQWSVLWRFDDSSEDLRSFRQVCCQGFGSVWLERWASESSRGNQAIERNFTQMRCKVCWGRVCFQAGEIMIVLGNTLAADQSTAIWFHAIFKSDFAGDISDMLQAACQGSTQLQRRQRWSRSLGRRTKHNKVYGSGWAQNCVFRLQVLTLWFLSSLPHSRVKESAVWVSRAAFPRSAMWLVFLEFGARISNVCGHLIIQY